jgi:hypothetical protein
VGAGFTVTLAGYPPGASARVVFTPLWRPSGRYTVSTVRVGLRGRVSVRVRPGSAITGLVASRPAGLRGTVAGRVDVTVRGRTRRAPVRFRIPAAPPSVAVEGALAPELRTPVTLSGAEPQASYTLDLEWTCPATGATDAEERLPTESDLGADAGGTVRTAVSDGAVPARIFDPACAGDPAPPAAEATLVLYREAVGPRLGEQRERLWAAPVSVTGTV